MNGDLKKDKIMKKQTILLVAAFEALTLTSCGPTSVEVTEQE